jgi:hypothetical protein
MVHPMRRVTVVMGLSAYTLVSKMPAASQDRALSRLAARMFRKVEFTGAGR